MGGCASKPKESDIPEKPQLETAAQNNTNGGEGQIEKPSVDLSEPEKEAQGSSSEPKAAAAEPVCSETVAETTKPTEDDVKADTKNAEDKVEVIDKSTVPAKEAGAEKSSVAPSKEEVKSDVPLPSL
ncbi:hypothetical protein CRYUN_Cryun19dG0100100 [Craigia yunnanensis]